MNKLSIERPIAVLVCGTNYGRIYVSAIRSAAGRYRLAGLLAAGSARSHDLAIRQKVPLFRSVAEVPESVSVACSAMSSSASATVLQLLRRGIHVICEHPQTPQFLLAAFDEAARAGVAFHINGHFGDLEASRAFAEHALERQSRESPAFLDILATDRSLYGCLDILARALPDIQPFEFCRPQGHHGFVVIQGFVAGSRATFQLQTLGGPDFQVLADCSRDYLVDFRITIGFPSGLLTLMSIAGPVVWNSNYNRSRTGERLSEYVHEDRTLTNAKLWGERVRANLDSLDLLVEHAGGGPCPASQDPGRLVEIANLWQALGMCLG